jgi:hypothetical protein
MVTQQARQESYDWAGGLQVHVAMKVALAGAVLIASFIAQRSRDEPEQLPEPTVDVKSIVWYAPFYSQSGYGSEVTTAV